MKTKAAHPVLIPRHRRPWILLPRSRLSASTHRNRRRPSTIVGAGLSEGEAEEFVWAGGSALGHPPVPRIR